MKFLIVALIAAASQVVYAQAPQTIIIQVGNPLGATPPQKNQFNPRVVAVNPGDTVTYVSNGAHRVREQANFTLCTPAGDGGFDSGPLPKGTRWTVPQEQLKPGKTIFFYCPEGNGTHCPSPNNMQGALVVRQVAGGAVGAPAGGVPAGGVPAGGSPAGVGPATGAAGAPKTVTVQVGQGGTKFVPDRVSVSPGDTVMFNWVGGNHNIVPSDAPGSCVRSTSIDTNPVLKALASGAPKTSGTHTFVVPTTAKVGDSFNYFCSFATHCSAGKMFASINVVAPGTAGPVGTAPSAPASTGAPGAQTTDPATASAGTSLGVATSAVFSLAVGVVTILL